MPALALLTAACGGVGSQLASAPKAAELDSLAVTAPPPAPPPGDTAIAPPPERFEGSPPPRRRAPARLTARGTPGPGTWAVVIGVNDYPGTAHDLRSAVADARDVDTALAGMGVPADHRLVLTDGQVTRQVLRSAAEWLTGVAGPEGVAVFVFAGHVRKTGNTESMVAADGGTVSDAELAGIFRRLQARRAWVVIAACYGGGFTEVLRPGVVLTGAAPADKEAFENLTFGNSYLVEFMVIRGMVERRADDTVQSAFEYAREALSLEYPERVPVQFDPGGSPLDLRPPGTARPVAPTTRTQPSTTPTTAAPPPPDKGSGDSRPPSGGSSGGSSPPTSTPPATPDTCKQLRIGTVVSCTSSR